MYSVGIENVFLTVLNGEKAEICCFNCCSHKTLFLECSRNSVNIGWHQWVDAWEHWLPVVMSPMVINVQCRSVANVQSGDKGCCLGGHLKTVDGNKVSAEDTSFLPSWKRCWNQCRQGLPFQFYLRLKWNYLLTFTYSHLRLRQKSRRLAREHSWVQICCYLQNRLFPLILAPFSWTKIPFFVVIFLKSFFFFLVCFSGRF